MAKGGNQVQKSEVTQSNIPDYAKPYFMSLMQGAQGQLNAQYVPYEEQRIADFTPEQRALQGETAALQTPGQFGFGSNLAAQAGLGSLAAGQYASGQFDAQQIGQPNLQQYQMQGVPNVQGGQYSAPQMGTAQTGFAPNLDYFQMQAPQQFGGVQAEQYMSPYAQSVMDVQKREAVRDAQKSQLVGDLGAARQGTYGGSRQLLAGMERERNLGTQLGDIQARGQQAAYENAQQQFERDRAAGMTAGQQNLQAALGVQQLGTQTGLQASLANLDAASQSNVQNLAAQLQTQGLTADQALRAALANQQAGLTTGQQNLEAGLQTQQLGTQTGLQALLANQQYGLEAQKLGEQSRQFGAGQALAGYGQAGQMAQTLGNLGQYQQQADISRLGYQGQTAAQEQAMQQQYLDQRYQDFLRQRDYQNEQLQQYSSLLRGVPVTPSTTATTYAPTPGMGQQLLGTGLGAASVYKTFAGA